MFGVYSKTNLDNFILFCVGPLQWYTGTVLSVMPLYWIKFIAREYITNTRFFGTWRLALVAVRQDFLKLIQSNL